MVQLSATRCSFILILWVSLVIFAAINLCVASQRVYVVVVVVVVYFVMTSSGNFWIHPCTCRRGPYSSATQRHYSTVPVKSEVSVCLSVRPSVRPHVTTDFDSFHELALEYTQIVMSIRVPKRQGINNSKPSKDILCYWVTLVMWKYVADRDHFESIPSQGAVLPSCSSFPVDTEDLGSSFFTTVLLCTWTYSRKLRSRTKLW